MFCFVNAEYLLDNMHSYYFSSSAGNGNAASKLTPSFLPLPFGLCKSAHFLNFSRLSTQITLI